MIKTNEHSDNLLELRNVTKRYLRRTALDDVSLNRSGPWGFSGLQTEGE